MSRDMDDFLREQDTWHKPVGGWRAWVRFALHWGAVLAFIALVILVVWASTSCSTVTPKIVDSGGPSYDGNAQTSGILGFFADGSVHVTESARNRFNLLVEEYSRDFQPPLKRDFGVTALPDGTYKMTAESTVDFEVMRAKKRAGIKPHQ